ncbi:hypothetical protein Taro_022848, partial [Colocasia esculenta]|nr:hypothetical protein [Colocasia esculenta]
MADSLDAVLEFLRRNKFTRAEAALRGELGGRVDLNGSMQKVVSEEKGKQKEDGGRTDGTQQGTSGLRIEEISNELVVKEIEVGSVINRSNSNKGLPFTQGHENASVDLYPWSLSGGDPVADPVPLKDSGSISNNFSELTLSGKTTSDKGDPFAHCKLDLLGEHGIVRGSASKTKIEVKHGSSQTSDCKSSVAYSSNDIPDNPWSKNEESWRECSVKTVFPFPKDDASCSYEISLNPGDGKKEKKKKPENNEVGTTISDQFDDVNRTFAFGKPQDPLEQKNIGTFDLPLITENHKEELPRLPPVKLKSDEKSVHMQWEEKTYLHGSGTKLSNADNTFLIGSFLDVPVGQEINSSGGKRAAGSNWLSVSQGIAEDTSDLVSGFATVGDESVDYPNEYWDSDEYDDDDDVGYTRQPIEDEAWFLAHEIDYPSDNEKGTGQSSVPDQQERVQTKDDDDDQSFAEEDSYFSGEQYFPSKNIEQAATSEDPMGLSMAETYGRGDESDLIAQYDGQLMDVEELNLMRAEPVWQGFVTQSNDLILLGNGRGLNECDRPQPGVFCIDDDHHGSVRSIGVGISSDGADIGSEIRESLVGGSSEGDIEYFHGHDHIGVGSRHSQHDMSETYSDKSKRDKPRSAKNDSDKYVMGPDRGVGTPGMSYGDGGFSFPPPLRSDIALKVESRKSLWSSRGTGVGCEDADDCPNGFVANDDMLASWRQKSSDSSLVKSSKDENIANADGSRASTASTTSNNGYIERDAVERDQDEQTSDVREEDPGTTLEDEEAAAVQEQIRQIRAQEEEFETFNLKIVHRKNRQVLFLILISRNLNLFHCCPYFSTALHLYPVYAHTCSTQRVGVSFSGHLVITGFEEDKNFHVVLNSVIAGRYHVTEYLGSAAFSKAIQAHDLHSGMDVCVKIIKNNKDFFDQSLDEIKLLKFVNKHDPADKYHILRLYDYFYYR